MKNKRLKAALLMLALGIMVPAATMDSEAAEADVSQVEAEAEVSGTEADESVAAVDETGAAEAVDSEEEAAEETAVTQDGWVDEEGGTRYYVDGSYVSRTVMQIDGYLYGFADDGFLHKDEPFTIFDYTTYDTHHYRARATGRLYVNAWAKDEYGNYFYYGEDGIAARGLLTVAKKQYYFDYEGRLMKNSTVRVEDTWYALDSEGVAAVIGKTAGWHKVNGKYYYIEELDQDGQKVLSLATNKTVQVKNAWYAFDGSGIMYEKSHAWVWDPEEHTTKHYFAAKGGQLLVNQWLHEGYESYYFGAKGAAVNGATVINDKKYYFNDGQLYKDTTIEDGEKCYIIDENGNCYDAKNNGWTTVNGDNYYAKDSHFYRYSVQKIGTKFYGFGWNGRMYDDEEFQMTDNDGIVRYYRAKAGGELYVSAWYGNYMYTKNAYAPDGFQTIGGKKYFFRGGMAISDEYFALDGKLYHADSKCIVTEITKNGFFYEDANRCDFVCVENNALVKNAWKKSSKSYYYFGEDGYAYRYGTHEINGKYYFFNQDGSMVSGGWVKDMDQTYYVSGSGALLTGDQKIDGKWYRFDSEGMMLTGAVQTETGLNLYGTDGVWVGTAKNGWNEINGSWYYLQGGELVKGLKTIGKQNYYFDYDGRMMTDDFAWEGGQKIIFNSKGYQVKQGWYEMQGRWYYVDPETGSVVSGEEREINGKTYRFDYEGMMVRDVVDQMMTISIASSGEVTAKKEFADGWTLHGGTYYYYKNGLPFTGWVGDCYVKGGEMMRNTYTPSGYWVGQTGAYQKTAGWIKNVDGTKNGMYAKSGGKLAKDEWLQIGGKWYYFYNYNCVSGARYIDGIWYIFDDNGIYQVKVGKILPDGWKKAGNDYYYFKGGALVTGALTIDGKEYSFSDSRLQTGPGFVRTYHRMNYYFESGQYYAASNGATAKYTGWKKIDGKWYYFQAGYKVDFEGWLLSGKKLYYQKYDGLATGVQLIRGKLYKFDSDGVLVKSYNYEEGWKQIEGNWYYFHNGEAVSNGIVTSGGKTYLFDGEGKLALNQHVGYYHSDSNGVILRNTLKQINGHYYYFGADGKSYYGVWKIGGKIYYFDY